MASLEKNFIYLNGHIFQVKIRIKICRVTFYTTSSSIADALNRSNNGVKSQCHWRWRWRWSKSRAHFFNCQKPKSPSTTHIISFHFSNSSSFSSIFPVPPNTPATVQKHSSTENFPAPDNSQFRSPFGEKKWRKQKKMVQIGL